MRYLFLFACIGFSVFGFSQNKMSKLLKQQNTESIPYIYVDSLKDILKDVVLLDSREEKEFKTSHLKEAICVGYDAFNLEQTKASIPDKNSKIVVYCSLGIRSEDVAEKLKKAGYKNVFNLYGGIFEWKNNNMEVVNAKEQSTDSIHTFSKAWSKWLHKGVKVYE